MKNVLFVTLCLIAATAWVVPGNKHVPASKLAVTSPTTPRTSIPEELTGQWQIGSFSLTTFWTYDGKYVGNAGSYSLAYKFTKDGYAEQFLYIEQNSYGLRTQLLGYRKGTVAYDASARTLQFFATEGNYRSFFGSKKTEKPYAANDLYPNYTDVFTNVTLINDSQGRYLVFTGKSGSQLKYKKLM